jgi:hypothetical protein
MAVRREDGRKGERPDQQLPNEDAVAQAEPQAIGQPRVRPEVLAAGRKVIAEDRALLERLAAYDRGEGAER